MPSYCLATCWLLALHSAMHLQKQLSQQTDRKYLKVKPDITAVTLQWIIIVILVHDSSPAGQSWCRVPHPPAHLHHELSLLGWVHRFKLMTCVPPDRLSLPWGFNTLGVSLPDHNDVEVSGLNLILDHVCHWNQKPCIINAQAGSSSTRYAQLHIVSVLQVVKDCVFHCDWSSYVHYMYAAASKWQLSLLTSLCARYVIPMKFARNSIFSLYWHFILKMAACITWHHMPCWDYDIIVYV